MKKQFHIKITGKEELIIDLNDNESVTIKVDNPPIKFQEKEPLLSRVQVDGLRWTDKQHFHLGWIEQNIEIDDEIRIKLTQSNKSASPLTKDEEYIAPEEECNFCHKKKSEVEHLVEKDYMARICNECVELALNAIEDHRNAT